MKLLLDMYRSAPKEQRDKVQLMAAEKKTKSEVISAAQCRRFVNMIGKVVEVNLFGPLRRFWLDFYVFFLHGWMEAGSNVLWASRINVLVSGRGAAAEAEGAGGEGEEGRQENG